MVDKCAQCGHHSDFHRIADPRDCLHGVVPDGPEDDGDCDCSSFDQPCHADVSLELANA